MKKVLADMLAISIAKMAIGTDETSLLPFKGDGSGTCNAKEVADFIRDLSARFVTDLDETLTGGQVGAALNL